MEQPFGGQFLRVYLANTGHTVPGCALSVRVGGLAVGEFAHGRARGDPLVAVDWVKFE